MSKRDRRLATLCAISGKRKYRSQADALVSNADRPLAARAYPCPYCGFWHLTRRVRVETA